MTKPRYGLVLGRFQPLHIGHMEFLEAAKLRCERLVIGVTNPDIRNIEFNAFDPKRSQDANNPYSFFRRLEMIDRSLRLQGWASGDFAIVPAEIANTQALTALLPPLRHTVVLATVYDEWGEEKVRRMSAQGFSVEVMWRRNMSERVTSGTEIRRLMAEGGAWQHLVPPGIAEAMQWQDAQPL